MVIFIRYKSVLVLSVMVLLGVSSTTFSGAYVPDPEVNEYHKKYLSLKLGASVIENSGVSDADVTSLSGGEYSADVGHYVAAAIGMVMDRYRIEFEVANQTNDLDNLSAKSIATGIRGSNRIPGVDALVTTFLVNGYKDFVLSGGVSAYISSGVGIAYGELDLAGGNTVIDGANWNWQEHDQDDTVFAWQLGAGVGYELTKAMSFDVGYRYLGSSDFEYGNTNIEFGSHNVTAGVRYTF